MNSFDPLAWSPELRRALISVRPDFFGLPLDQQMRYRVKLPSQDRQAIVAALLMAHCHPQASEVADQESNGHIAAPLQNRINEWLQPLVGIGEDAFSLNESFRPEQTILDFPTLLSYDEDDHEFQEHARKEMDSAYLQRPYAGSLNATWARCMIGERLCYLTLYMAGLHIAHGIEKLANREVERLIPHRYVPRSENGRTEGGFIEWNRRLEAGGQEALLEELRRRVWTYTHERMHELQAEFNGLSQSGTFLTEGARPVPPEDELHLRIVFSDPRALARVRFTSFLSDCRAMERPAEELNLAESREAARVIQFVNDQYLELLRTFDPKVVPMRRQTRVLIHPNAFDAFNGDEDR
ncbi:MAG: hypothetical protein K2W93_10560 [Burkholderiaceae bacterium]|nr:hypothetical protein [Burkholderiaceae bacterium]